MKLEPNLPPPNLASKKDCLRRTSRNALTSIVQFPLLEANSTLFQNLRVFNKTDMQAPQQEILMVGAISVEHPSRMAETMPSMNSPEQKIGENPLEHTMSLHPDTVHLVDLVHLAKEMLISGTVCKMSCVL